MPISRCPRERLLPEIRRPLSADGCHATGLAPPSWFLTTSAASSVHGFRHVAAGTRYGFARFSLGSLVQTLRPVGAGPGSPLALHPAKVCSSSIAVPHRCGLLPSCRSSPRRALRHIGLHSGPVLRRGGVERFVPPCTDTTFCLVVTLQDRCCDTFGVSLGAGASVRRLPSPRGLPLDTTRRASGTGPLPVTRLRLAGCLVVSRRSCIRSGHVLLAASRPRGPRLRPHLRRMNSPEM
jgi:hypothetical protein